MPALIFIIAIIIIAIPIAIIQKIIRSNSRIADLEANNKRLTAESNNKDIDIQQKASEINKLKSEINLLSKYRPIIDIEKHCNDLRSETDQNIKKLNEYANKEAKELVEAAKSKVAKLEEKSEKKCREGDRQRAFSDAEAKRVISQAEDQAARILKDAYLANKDLTILNETLTAIKNTIAGYGNRYIVPSHSFIDSLAEEYGHLTVAKELKALREKTNSLSADGLSATCEYVEINQRNTAIRFVTDAFNGKVDSILSEVSETNYGILEQRIKDSYRLVNLNGTACGNAVIKQDFLDLRLTELRLAATIQKLKSDEKEEQRRIREQIRDEEKARRDYEKALKETAREEELIKKAMEKLRAEFQTANEEEKLEYSNRIADLTEKLKIAEEKNQRALSMAQQTKRGHIYIISNLGSFGENVYKLGMTRRLDPFERVKELGDASVPFGFDVHAVIFSEDAPKFEKELHKKFAMIQVNKVNPRKEFFRIDIKTIKDAIASHGVEVKWTMTAAAAEYRETLAIESRIGKDSEVAQKWQASFEDQIEMQKEYNGEESIS